MMLIDSTTWRAARRALERAVALYVADSDVTFIDLGFMTAAPQNAELAVRIHRRHQPSAGRELAAPDLGFAVESVESNFRFHLRQAMTEAAAPICRELMGGIAITNEAGRAFTLGGKVRDRQTGEAMLLSSWHVLADAWARDENVLIYQPAANENHPQAMLAEFTRSAISHGLDAAVLRLHNGADLRNEQEGIGAVTGVALPQLGMRVQKSGAGSGVTSGVITGILGYSMQRYANRQQLIGPLVCITPENPAQKICATGDSGAWWLENATQRAVALHFAGGDQPNFALAFSMPEVLGALEVEIDTTLAPATADPAPLTQPEAPEKIAAVLVAPETQSMTTTAIQVAGPSDETSVIDSPIKDVILAADFAVIDKLAPESAEPFRDFIWNTLKSRAPRLAGLAFPSTRRAAYRLAQAMLVVAAAMTMIGFDRRMTHEQDQREEEIAQLHKHLQSIKVIAKIDSARQKDIFRIMGIIDRFNPEMNSALKLNLAAEICALRLRYHQLEVELICAVITHESAKTWNPEIVSFAGAMGLMQMLPSTGIGVAQQEGVAWTSAEDILFNPIYNVRLGCRYLAGMIAKHGLEAGLAGYNGGDRQAKNWKQKNEQLHPETAFYVPEILKLYRGFQGSKQADAVEAGDVINYRRFTHNPKEKVL